MMKAEIKYTLGRCHYENEDECDINCSRCCNDSKWKSEIEKGYSGEIQEYEVENEGFEAYINIVINKKKKINLCIDMYGRDPEDDSYCYKYDECEYFMVDGKTLWGKKTEVEEKSGK